MRAYPSTSMSLLAKTIAGDPEAWDRLIFLYSPLVVRWCRKRCLKENDIHDLGQDVFLTLFLNLGKFQKTNPEHSFRKWLKTLTGNKITDYLRQKCGHAIGGSEARAMFENYAFDPNATATDVDDAESDRAILLRRCLEIVKSEFEDKTYAAFWAVAVDEKSPADVARSLGMSVGAVYTAKSKVTRRLRALAEELDLESPDA
jgi:RNA polymerase sigma-70 factor (ECF subfamily)